MIALAALVVLSGWLWWEKVYMNPTRVFWSMMSNNLATDSVVRHTHQTQSGQTSDEYIQIAFGAVNASRSVTTLSQNDAAGPTTVVSETIGTPTNDYSRYISIKTTQKSSTGKLPDTSKVVGIWGKTPDAPAGQKPSLQYFQQGVLGIVPFANLTNTQRSDLVKIMRDDNVYDIAAGAPKRTKVGKRAAYVYSVNINPAAYIGMLGQYAKDLGLGDIGLDPSQYAGSQPLKADFTVDKLSRQLVSISYTGTTQSETFSSQGLEQPITLPTQTIPISDLQNRVQSIQ